MELTKVAWRLRIRGMKIHIISLFPDVLASYVNASILKRAQKAGLVEIVLHDLREYGVGKHRVTDEPPFGGGSGMLLKPEPLFAVVEQIGARERSVPVILLSPQGRVFDQTVAEELAQGAEMVLVCGRYEGFDERVRQQLATDEISIGDYVLTGGELGALVIVDAVARLIPGVLGSAESAPQDSHSTGLLEGAHYTKPVDFRGMRVPDVLRSGHAQKIATYRRESALRRTWQRRPEMLLSAELTPADKQFLALLARESAQEC